MAHGNISPQAPRPTPEWVAREARPLPNPVSGYGWDRPGTSLADRERRGGSADRHTLRYRWGDGLDAERSVEGTLILETLRYIVGEWGRLVWARTGMCGGSRLGRLTSSNGSAV